MGVRVPLVPRWLRWSAVVAVAAVVFYLSVVTAPPEAPVAPAPPDLIPLDKWRHFFAYAALAGSLAYATATREWRARTLAAFVIGLTVAYGVGIEFAQSGIPDRYFSVDDAYANALGALLVAPWFALRHRLSFVRVPAGDTSEE